MKLDKFLLENLYYDYSPRLTNYGQKFISDKRMVEDMVQEAYYKLWVKYSDTDKTLSQWTSILFSIVRNMCIDCIRKSKFLTETIIQLPESIGEIDALYEMDFNNPERGADRSLQDELWEEIKQVESSFSDTTRCIFRMSRVEKMKNKEIAEKLDISVKTVEKHITIALKAFRKQFETHDLTK